MADRMSRRTWMSIGRRGSAIAMLAVAVLIAAVPAAAQDAPNAPLSIRMPEGLATGPQAWTSPAGLSSAIQVMLLLTVLSLAPAILLMTTCFVRVIVVLGLLRQALGTQNLPPSQVITAISLFITLLVMSPVWNQVYQESIAPYSQKKISLEEAWDAGVKPIRKFMTLQIERTGNSDDVWLFMSHLPKQPAPQSYDDVPLQALLPAFMLSELKTAFVIGFQIYLPFVILNMSMPIDTMTLATTMSMIRKGMKTMKPI